MEYIREKHYSVALLRIKELEKQLSWISVDDRLPKIGETVDVIFGNNVRMTDVTRVPAFKWEKRTPISVATINDVTHWKALPELPEPPKPPKEK